MLDFVIRRLFQSLLVLLVVSVLVFVGVFVIGNPIDILISADANQAEREALISRFGLDRPVYEQYLSYLAQLVRGDFGRSYIHDTPALQLVLSRLPATLELALFAMVLSVGIGIPLGMVAGRWPDHPVSRSIMALSIVGFSLPTFWIGIVLMIVFSVNLGVLPSSGRGVPGEFLGLTSSYFSRDGLAHLLLPGITLALYKTGVLIRLTRAGVRELLRSEMVKFARAKGLGYRRIMFVHVLRNLLVTLVTVIGMELGSVIAFAVVVEKIFAWPGVGKLMIDSIGMLDRPVIVAYILAITLMFLVINLVVDLLYALLDPRIRASRI